ncbi:MAG: hypothetical protein OXR66_03250 [Candidatus Woesearchaeota archaeon]|nr:hypothetical protein [Candidatus Woesearchaeota archaeon]
MATNVELSTRAENVCDKLEVTGTKESNMIYKAIERTERHLKENVHFGDAVAKRLIPLPYKQEGVTNLFRVSLPCYWRLVYTLRRENMTCIVFILDILSHKDYDKLFGYKKR